MKRSFITGLVILLPLAMTFVVVMFLFNFLTEPFTGLVRGIFEHYDIFQTGFFFFSAEQIRQCVSQFLILILLISFTVLLGFIARWFFFHYVLQFWDFILHRIPIVRTVYKTSQDVIQTIFGSETQSFKQVVLVPFPNAQTSAVGLVTREAFPGLEGDYIAVFVPTTPNPTSGFLMMYHPEDVAYMDMSVEEAFKYIISCGVIAAPFKTVSRKEAPLVIQENLEKAENGS